MQIDIKTKHKSAYNPAQLIAGSFLLVISIGAFILTLPICSKDGSFTNFIDALFTSTSATCVTGLVVFDTFEKWNIFGQIVILLLIQIGGLGLVTLTTFFNLILGRKLGLRSTALASESASSINVFDSAKLIKSVIKVSLSFELIGAFLLGLYFVPNYGGQGVYMSIFLSVSAFCNAGFDILGFLGQYSSLTTFYNNPLVLYTIMGLIVCGGLGFVVWNDLFNIRKNKKLILHSKIVLIMTGILIFVGSLIFLTCEWDNPATMANMDLGQKINNSIFQSITTRTAGFNSIDIAGLNSITKMFSIILMFIGAAPGSTGGGIKVTTFAVIILTVICVIRGRDDTQILGRKVEKSVIYKALAVVTIACGALITSTSVIFFTNGGETVVSGINTLFEATSAFATVGLSTGVTLVTNSLSRIVLIITMFIGRVGPVSLALSLAFKLNNKKKNQVVPDGKILVG